MEKGFITLQEYYERSGVRKTPDFAKDILVTIRDGEGNPSQPRKDQCAGLNLSLRFNRFGLYDDPGVGKTVISQAYGIYRVWEGNKCLVLMPPVLLYQFLDSFTETYPGIENHLTFHVFDEDPLEREILEGQWNETGWPDILCMTPQLFYKYYAQLKTIYSVLIADEVHKYLTSAEAGTYKRIMHFLGGWNDSAALLMTGTPIGNLLTQAYGLTKLTYPAAYFDYQQFERQHCVYTTVKFNEPKQLKSGKTQSSIRKLTGYKNVAKLEENLYKHARRVIKEDVLSLTEPAIDVVPIRLYPEHQRLYETLSKQRILELGNDEIFTALQDQALRQAILQLISSPHKYAPEDAKIRNAPLEALDALIEERGDSEKVIVFANYLETAETLKKHLKKLNPAILNGSVNNKEKEKEKFLHDPTCKVLIAHPNSAGVGLNLQSVCNFVIFFEPCSTPGDFKQAFERVYRGGQLNKVVVKILKVLHTGSVKSIENMMRKATDIQMVNRDRVSMLNYISG